jgi:hypothetical protein
MKADLHIHTYYSDGLNSPKEILQICKQKGINILSITDHDTIDGYLKAKEIVSKKIKLIPGVEITGIKTEILGYLFNIENSQLLALLEEHKQSKKKYIKKKIEGLKDLNIDIEYEDINEKAGKGEILTNTHIASLLIDKKYASTIQEAFNKYISKIKVRLDTPPTQPKKIIKTIINARGVPVLPHPWLFPNYIKEDLEYFVIKLQKYGLQGIETTGYCPPELLEFEGKNIFSKIKKIAKDLNLIETGGSDFHGEKIHPHNKIGDFTIDSKVVEELEKVVND